MRSERRVSTQFGWELLLLLFVSLSLPICAEVRYIVPVFALKVDGAEGRWSSSIQAANLAEVTTNVRVSRIFPMIRGGCSYELPFTLFTLPPYRSDVASSLGLVPCTGMKIGALEIVSDHEIEVEVIAFGNGRSQIVEVAHRWIEAGRRSTLFEAFAFNSRMNLFLVNPNPHAIEIEYWTDYGGDGSTMVSAESTVLVGIEPGFACPLGCGSGTKPIHDGMDLHLRSDFEYLAAISSPEEPLLPVVRIARQTE